MTSLKDSVAVPMGIPIGGMDLNQPLASMDPNNSPWLLNVDCENQYNAVRPGVVIHCTIQDVTTISALGVYGASTGQDAMFAYCVKSASNNRIYDVSTSTESLVHTTGGTEDDVYATNYNTRLAFVTNTDPANNARYWDGSSWSSWNFTDGATQRCGFTVFNYRGRLYVFLPTNQTFYYANTISAISGASFIAVDLSDIFDTPGGFSWGARFPFSNNNLNDTYLAAGNQNGEVVVYGGSYPGSATWSIIQKFQLDSGAGFNAILKLKNDIWIFTKTGAVSLRQLLIGGNEDPSLYSPSYPINDHWTKLLSNWDSEIWQGVEQGMSACLWPEKNRIFILIAGYLDEDGVFSSSGATIFSYNMLTRAWSIWRLTGISGSHVGGLTYFQNGVYFYTANVVMKIDPTVFKDETYNSASTYTGYPYVIDGAYSDLGTSAKRKRIVGFNPIIKTDFGGSKVTMKAGADVGRSLSDATAVDLQDGFNSPQYSVGAEGARVKYRILGTSDTASTDGLRLFAMDALVKPKESTR